MRQVFVCLPCFFLTSSLLVWSQTTLNSGPQNFKRSNLVSKSLTTAKEVTRGVPFSESTTLIQCTIPWRLKVVNSASKALSLP